MKQEIYDKKIDEKYGYRVPESQTSKPEMNPKTRKEMREGQHKSKRCICGVHSIKGYKEKWKYPKWKKKSRREKDDLS